MQLVINNNMDADIILSLGKSDYLIKAGAKNLAFDLPRGRYLLKARRAEPIPPPAFKKAFWTEFLGIFSLLFFKPWFYMFDISSAFWMRAMTART